MPTGEAYADWEAVYRDNVDRVYRTMFAKVGNRPDAEDLTAEVFLAALRPLRVSASVGEVRAYLAATARTVLARHWRRTLGLEVTTLDDEHTATAAAEQAPPAPPGRTRAILAALPANYRRILELRFLDSCSVQEAAAALGVSTANAKVLQHRALRRAAQLALEADRDRARVAPPPRRPARRAAAPTVPAHARRGRRAARRDRAERRAAGRGRAPRGVRRRAARPAGGRTRCGRRRRRPPLGSPRAHAGEVPGTPGPSGAGGCSCRARVSPPPPPRSAPRSATRYRPRRGPGRFPHDHSDERGLADRRRHRRAARGRRPGLRPRRRRRVRAPGRRRRARRVGVVHPPGLPAHPRRRRGTSTARATPRSSPCPAS